MWKLYLLLDPLGYLLDGKLETRHEKRSLLNTKGENGRESRQPVLCSQSRKDGEGPAAQQDQCKLMAQSSIEVGKDTWQSNPVDFSNG